MFLSIRPRVHVMNTFTVVIYSYCIVIRPRLRFVVCMLLSKPSYFSTVQSYDRKKLCQDDAVVESLTHEIKFVGSNPNPGPPLESK